MKIYLSIDNGADIMEIPVIPGEFQVSKPQGDETFETVDGSEIAFIDPAGLKSISWSSFFPSRDYPYVQGERFDDVWQYGYKLDTWIKLKYPIRLVFYGAPINMAVKVTQFDYHMGSDGDIYYDIELKEFPLVDTETEGLTMAQYDELKGMIEALTLKVEALSGGTVINKVEDGAPFYDQALKKFVEKGCINGSGGSGLDLTEDMARTLTIIDRYLTACGYTK